MVVRTPSAPNPTSSLSVPGAALLPPIDLDPGSTLGVAAEERTRTLLDAMRAGAQREATRSTSEPMPGVLLVGGDPILQHAADFLNVMLNQIGARAETARSVTDATLDTRRHLALVVMESELAPNAAQELMQRLDTVPSVLLILGNSGLPVFRPTGWQETSIETIAKPKRGDQLAVLVTAALLRAGYSLPPLADLGAPSSTPAPPELRSGRVLVTFSPQGGAGKSTIAVNLAVALATLHSRRVLLVDADLWFGNIGTLLNIAAEHGIADVCAEPDLGLPELQRYLVRHESGVMALVAPPDPAVADLITAEQLTRVIQSYRALFDYVIVNTQSSYDERTLQLLEAADQILLVLTPDVSGVPNAVRSLRIADQLHFREKLLLVLNHATGDVRKEDMERALGATFAATVVHTYVVQQSANLGVPLVMQDPKRKHHATRDLIHLATVVAGEPAVAGGRRASDRVAGHTSRFHKAA